MKITNYICPRQSGKSLFATMQYLANSDKNIIMFHNANQAKDFCNKLNKHNINESRVLYQSQYSKLYEMKCETLILDEYLFYSKKYKTELYNIIEKNQLQNDEKNSTNIITFSTSDRVYNKPIFDIVKKYNTYHFDNVKEFLNKEYAHLNLEDYTDDFINNELDYLEFNLLVYPSATNISVDWYYRKEHEAILKVINDKAKYELEFKNQWLYNNLIDELK